MQQTGGIFFILFPSRLLFLFFITHSNSPNNFIFIIFLFIAILRSTVTI